MASSLSPLPQCCLQTLLRKQNNNQAARRAAAIVTCSSGKTQTFEERDNTGLQLLEVVSLTFLVTVGDPPPFSLELFRKDCPSNNREEHFKRPLIYKFCISICLSRNNRMVNIINSCFYPFKMCRGKSTEKTEYF